MRTGENTNISKKKNTYTLTKKMVHQKGVVQCDKNYRTNTYDRTIFFYVLLLICTLKQTKYGRTKKYLSDYNEIPYAKHFE